MVFCIFLTTCTVYTCIVFLQYWLTAWLLYILTANNNVHRKPLKQILMISYGWWTEKHKTCFSNTSKSQSVWVWGLTYIVYLLFSYPTKPPWPWYLSSSWPILIYLTSFLFHSLWLFSWATFVLFCLKGQALCFVSSLHCFYVKHEKDNMLYFSPQLKRFKKLPFSIHHCT